MPERWTVCSLSTTTHPHSPRGRPSYPLGAALGTDPARSSGAEPAALWGEQPVSEQCRHVGHKPKTSGRFVFAVCSLQLLLQDLWVCWSLEAVQAPWAGRGSHTKLICRGEVYGREVCLILSVVCVSLYIF